MLIAARRVARAVDAWKLGMAPTLVVTGGGGWGRVTEAEAFATALRGAPSGSGSMPSSSWIIVALPAIATS